MTADEHFAAVKARIEDLEAQFRAIGKAIKHLHDAIRQAGEAYIDQHGGSPDMAAAVAPKTKPE